MYLTRSGVSTSRTLNTHNRVLYLTSEDLGLSSAVAQLGTPVGVHAWSVCACSLSAVEYASIDWHDFVVVETIAFREDESGMITAKWI